MQQDVDEGEDADVDEELDEESQSDGEWWSHGEYHEEIYPAHVTLHELVEHSMERLTQHIRDSHHMDEL
jgi:hypothetical protein